MTSMPMPNRALKSSVLPWIRCGSRSFFHEWKNMKKIFFVGLITPLLMLSENKKSVLHRFFTQCRKWYCYFFFLYFNSVHSYLSVQQGTIVRATSPFWNLKSTYLKATILKLQSPFIWDWVINSSQFLKKKQALLGQPIRGLVFGGKWLEFISQSQTKGDYNFSSRYALGCPQLLLQQQQITISEPFKKQEKMSINAV